MLKWILSCGALMGVIVVAACSDSATTPNPCPRGLCTGTDGGPDPGNDSGVCKPGWGCTSWAKGADGKYTRTCSDANKCADATGKPTEGPVALPDLDMDFYKCKVEPIFDRGCAMMGCHGTETGRPFKIYARGRLRADEMVDPVCLQTGPQNLAKMGSGTTMCQGWFAHTKNEWQSNYDISRSFMVGVQNADDSEILSQTRVGGKAHAGVHEFKATDKDYLTIKSWLGGAKLGTPCDPTPN